MRNLYKESIESTIGAVVTIDEDGDITFKYGRMGVLCLPISVRDPYYFRLIDQVEVDEWSRTCENMALEAVNTVSGQVKCITQFVRKIGEKLVLANSAEAYISVPGVLPSSEFVGFILERYCDLLDSGRSMFSKKYGELKDSI